MKEKGIKKLVAESRAKRQARESTNQNLRRVGSGAMGNEGTYMRNNAMRNNSSSGTANSAMRMRPRGMR